MIILLTTVFLVRNGGIRRFQNEDGSLTPEGQKRYRTSGKKFAKKIIKDDKLDNSAGKIHSEIYFDKNLKNYNRESENGRKIKEAYETNSKRVSELNTEINKELEKKYGKFMNLDFENQMRYYAEGADMMEKMSANDPIMKQTKKDWEEYSKKYEKEVNEFLKGYMGEYGDMPSQDPMALSYNTKTGEMGQQSLRNRVAIEMLRYAGGNI